MRHVGFVRSILLLSVASLLLGCAGLIESASNSVATCDAIKKLKLFVPKLAKCMQLYGAYCDGDNVHANCMCALTDLENSMTPSAAMFDGAPLARAEQQQLAAARAVLGDPVQEKLCTMVRSILGVKCGDSPSTAAAFDVSSQEIRTYFAHMEDAVATSAFDTLAARTRWILEALHAKENGDAAAFDANKISCDMVFKARFYMFLSMYTRAYFRDGRFFEVKLEVDLLYERLLVELRKRIPQLEPDGIKKLTDGELYQALAKIIPFPEDDTFKKIVAFLRDGTKPFPTTYSWGKINDGGFVARDGSGAQFPPISLSVRPLAEDPISAPKLNFEEIGSDLVRVFLEAFFDALFGVPAVEEATGAKGELSVPESCLLARFDPRIQGVTLEEFGNVKSVAGQMEGTVFSAVGQAIRGIAWLSLDNEALATLIQTFFAVTFKKLTEKVLWCRYSCFPTDEPEDGPNALPFAPAAGEFIDVTVRFSDFAGLRR